MSSTSAGSPDPSVASAIETPSRRTVLATGAGFLGLGGAGMATLATVPTPAVAVEGDPAAFEVGEAPTVTSNEGRISSVYLSPEIAVTWTDFSDGVETVEVTLAAGTDEGIDVIYEETLHAERPDATPGDVGSISPLEDAFEDPDDPSIPDLAAAFDAVDGGIVVTLDRADVTERGETVTSDALSDATLAGGESTATELDIVLRVTVQGGEDEASVVETSTVEVGVTNPAGDVDAGGTVGVDAS
ncbi:hypothetical protein [Halorubrum vacuolatum]|uniref:Uncharacterized protein n=1 Tax=Halorubrum vacuolatum TaxID=63740 RepID=A0A238WVS4_HALVU|nr:hypothetical protein [Halorubrum vacuolatum]SNR50284.1 hypothetical protein SAMN06264855_11074 [Halorubrum vacuolatum]